MEDEVWESRRKLYDIASECDAKDDIYESTREEIKKAVDIRR